MFAYLLLQLLVLMQFCSQASAFYFYSNTGERKCFHKELSKGTLLQGRYQLQVYDDSLDSYKDADDDSLNVVIDVEEVFDDNHRVVHQKGSTIGDFTFTALDTGEHMICFQPQTGGWMARMKTLMNIEFEVGAASQVDSKKKTAMQSLQQKVQILVEKVSEIKREQELVRDREALFRDVSESANSRAMWWSVLSLIILGGTCAWQLTHLRSFFVKQKVL